MAFKNVKKIAFLVVPLALVCFLNVSVNAEGEAEPSVTSEQKSIIIDHCDTIKDSLRSLQKADSRTRVYLGRYFETILSNFMVPLNIRLVENSISNTKLIENQTNFANRRDRFNSDFISYQQTLEELVNTNCKNEPEQFYTKLIMAREKRAIVSKDVTRLKGFTDDQVRLVQELKAGMEQN